MNDTEIKTRYGLILQAVTAAALREAGYAFAEDAQYEPTCERPDFLIPDVQAPWIMIEVHQTDTRDSLRMKTLRAFTAVTEAKGFFGGDLIAVNVLFGNPEQDFLSSPIAALCAIYDVSLFPAEDAECKADMTRLEAECLDLAKNPKYNAEAAVELAVKSEKKAIRTLAGFLRRNLEKAATRVELRGVWAFERERLGGLGAPPVAGPATYHKRYLLRTLFLRDAHFDEVVAKKNPDDCSPSTQRQLVRTGVADLVEDLDGDHVVLDTAFAEYVQREDTARIRLLCKDVLGASPEMHWYFEDIRDETRRLSMAEAFLESVRKGKAEFQKDLDEALLGTKYSDIDHARCWYCDLISLISKRSFNHYNKAIFQDTRTDISLWNVFSNLVMRLSSLVKYDKRRRLLSTITADHFFAALTAGGIDVAAVTKEELSGRLLTCRLQSAIKLRTLNPLVEVVADICASRGLVFERPNIDSLLSDLADDRGVGKFLVFVISLPQSKKKVLASIVAAHEGNGDHKSKEWAARRLASLYRIKGGKVRRSEYQDAIFVLDGEWSDKDVARLYRSGWNRIVRLGAVDKALSEMFGVSSAGRPARSRTIVLPDEELPLAAEVGDEADVVAATARKRRRTT